MKKYIYMIAAAALAFAGCAKEVVKDVDTPVSEGKMMTFKAVVEEPIMDAETKATLGRDGVFTWNDNDLVCFVKTGGSGIEHGTIQGDEISVPDGEYEYAIYPASAYSTYQHIAWNNHNNQPIVVAKVSGSELKFYHVASLINLKISGVTQTSRLEFSASAAGAYGNTIEFDSEGIPSITGDNFSSPLITTDKLTPAQLAAGVTISVPCKNYEGFQVSVMTDSYNTYYTKSTTKTFDLSTRGKLLNMKEFAVPTYTVAGCSWDGNTVVASIFGTAWAPTETENDMTLGTDGIYSISYTSSDTRHIQFKVVENHSWDNSSWGGASKNGNFLFNIRTAGKVNITFNPLTKAVAAWDETVYTVAGEAWKGGTERSTDIFTTKWDEKQTANDMTMLEDGTYSITYKNVPASTWIGFKVVANHTWGTEWPSSNYEYTSPDYLSNITITFNPYGNVDDENEGVGLITGVSAVNAE